MARARKGYATVRFETTLAWALAKVIMGHCHINESQYLLKYDALTRANFTFKGTQGIVAASYGAVRTRHPGRYMRGILSPLAQRSSYHYCNDGKACVDILRALQSEGVGTRSDASSTRRELFRPPKVWHHSFFSLLALKSHLFD